MRWHVPVALLLAGCATARGQRLGIDFDGGSSATVTIPAGCAARKTGQGEEGSIYAVSEQGAERPFALLLLGVDNGDEPPDEEPVEIAGHRFLRFQSHIIEGPNTAYRYEVVPRVGTVTRFDIARLPYPRAEPFEALLSSFRVELRPEARAPTER